MMQFDVYHSYAVDEHTVFAMGILNGIETGRLSEMRRLHPLLSMRLICAMNYMWRCYHDIAKGRGGDHSILGAEVALAIPGFGMSEAATETVACGAASFADERNRLPL